MRVFDSPYKGNKPIAGYSVITKASYFILFSTIHKRHLISVNRFPIRERGTCHGSKSLPPYSEKPKETTTCTFDSHLMRSCTLKDTKTKTEEEIEQHL